MPLPIDFHSAITAAQPSLVAVFAKRFGAGAGILWSADGLVLTNRHVLGRQIRVFCWRTNAALTLK